MNTQCVQLDQTTNDEDRGDFTSSIEYDHPIHTLIFGNRMCGKLEIVPSYSNETTVLELSEIASQEIEIKEGRGTVVFSKRTSPYSFFRPDDTGNRHETLIRAVVPQNSLRRVCAHKRLACVSITDYEAEEFSVNASIGSHIHIENLRCGTFRYEAISGACTIHATSIKVDNLTGLANSLAHVVLSGQALNHRLTAGMHATVDSKELDVENAYIDCMRYARVILGNVRSVKVQASERSRVFLNQDGSIDADNVSSGHLVY